MLTIMSPLGHGVVREICVCLSLLLSVGFLVPRSKVRLVVFQDSEFSQSLSLCSVEVHPAPIQNPFAHPHSPSASKKSNP